MPRSTAGMYCRGMTPPTISSTNWNPDPLGSGAIRIQQSPYWPRPPVCFLCFPCPSARALNVSRYAIFGFPITACTPNLRVSRPTMISRWRSPSPRISVCPSSPEYSCWNVGSSSCSLCNPFDSFSSSPRCFTSIASVITGSGKGILGSTIAWSLVESVSLVCVSRSLATTPMSPACSSGISTRSFPTLTRRVVDVLAVLDGPRVHSEKRHVAHMRLGDRLEHLRHEPPRALGLQRHPLRAPPPLRFHRRPLVRRWDQLHELREQGARPVGQLGGAAEQ